MAERNEEFVHRLANSNKSQAISLLRKATDEEYKSVVELLGQAESFLSRAEINKCQALPSCLKLKKLKTKKQLIRLFSMCYRPLITLLGCLIARIIERGIAEVYLS